VSTIFDASRRGAQRRLHECYQQARAKEVLAELNKHVRDNKPRAAKLRARFLESQSEHASAWLHASRRDKGLCMQNGHFRIAVAIRLGVNPFVGASPTMRCSWCKGEVGDDVYSHCIECPSARKGDNNRRHQFLQQTIANLLKATAQGEVHNVPQVLAFLGAGAHEMGHHNPVQAQARPQASPPETIAQNSRRQGDLGLVDVFQRGQTQLVDLTVSDGGGANPNSTYVAGTLRKQREEEKTATYMGRFSGLSPEQLVVLSFDCMGGATENTKAWLQHLIDALAAVSPEHRSVVAARVWSSVSVSLQKSLALNALQFRNGKLEAPARAVGQPGNPDQPTRKQTRKRRNTSRPSSSAGSQPERSEQPASETGSDSEWHPPKSQQPAQALRGEPRGADAARSSRAGTTQAASGRSPPGSRRPCLRSGAGSLLGDSAPAGMPDEAE
jgi:hypothetical protein